MGDLKHELEENRGCKPTHSSPIAEVEALNGTSRQGTVPQEIEAQYLQWITAAAFHEIVLAGPPPIHAEKILTSRNVEQRARSINERSKWTKREKAERDKVHELSRYVPWPASMKHGPRQHLVVQKGRGHSLYYVRRSAAYVPTTQPSKSSRSFPHKV
jgi:hypothetical protein